VGKRVSAARSGADWGPVETVAGAEVIGEYCGTCLQEKDYDKPSSSV
jgi:hypothetical protein